MALEHALDSVADLNQPTHWQTLTEYHPKTTIFENSLKIYQKKIFSMNFFREIVVAIPAKLFLLQKHNNKNFVKVQHPIKGFL